MSLGHSFDKVEASNNLFGCKMTELIKIDCPNCKTRYNLPPEKLPKEGKIKINCKKCGSSFSFSLSEKEGAEKSAVEDKAAFETMIGQTLVTSGEALGGAIPKDCKITLSYKESGEEVEKVIEKRLTIIGRSEGDIVINDTLISRKHASIEIKSPTMVELKDLASTNGVFHNGMKVSSVFLQSGDDIKLGSTLIHVTTAVKFM